MSSWDLHLGSCLDPLTGLASLADDSVDVTITDPPYSQHTHEKQWAAAALTDGLPDCGLYDAAIAVAKHCRMAGMDAERTTRLLARLSVEVPDWRPRDPAELAELAGAWS